MKYAGCEKTVNANPVLLQKKDESIDFFYRSDLYPLIKEGVSDLHCMSDKYLADELTDEYLKKQCDRIKSQQLKPIWQLYGYMG